MGGKSQLSREIISLFPEHTTYVEVFGGALCVLYHKISSRIEILNDINGELINLHLMIKTRPEILSSYLSTPPHSRELFALIKDGKLRAKNNIERAAHYFYLIKASFGAKGSSFARIMTI